MLVKTDEEKPTKIEMLLVNTKLSDVDKCNVTFAESDLHLPEIHVMVDIFTFSEKSGHATNEDVFTYKFHPDDSSCCLCALADGQGGQSGGQQAAYGNMQVGIRSIR